jgi:transcription antitermination factor NusG
MSDSGSTPYRPDLRPTAVEGEAFPLAGAHSSASASFSPPVATREGPDPSGRSLWHSPSSPEVQALSGASYWLVCHTKPRCEKRFAALLNAEKFGHYLPLIPSVRRYGQQTKHFTKPLFPGYVFAQVDAEKKTRIYQQDLLARAIHVSDVSTFLKQLEEVRTIVASGLELSVMPLLTKGRRVRITGGPLDGLEGMVDNPVNPRGVVISVDVLQQGLLVKVPAENLKVLP